MDSNIRSWLVWLIPFFVSGGMALGAFIGMSSISDAALQEGQAGDIAGALGALMVLICILVGFFMATFTIIVAKALGRGTPDRISLRLGLSVLGSITIGALAVYSDDVSTSAAWFLLIGGPVLISWFCGTQRAFPNEETLIE